jgi:hypothetical protein
MRSISRCLLLALTIHGSTALSQTTSTPTPTTPSGMTVHRLLAGDLDATGASMAASTHGDFSVRMPCRFNDFSMKGQDSEPVLEIEALGCRRADQRKYSASRFKYRTGATAARKYFDAMSGPRRLEGETVRRRLMFNGFPALQVDFQSASRCGAMRSVLIGSDLLTLTAEGPPIKCDGLMTQAESFFDSLQVTLRATDPAPEPPPSNPP